MSKSKLVQRFGDFCGGWWSDSRGGQSSKETTLDARRCFELVQMGGLSTGRQVLEGADIFPGNNAILQMLQEPRKRRFEPDWETRSREPHGTRGTVSFRRFLGNFSQRSWTSSGWTDSPNQRRGGEGATFSGDWWPCRGSSDQVPTCFVDSCGDGMLSRKQSAHNCVVHRRHWCVRPHLPEVDVNH